MKVLFLSAEVAPFAKSGGLGDVGGSLPLALHALGHDVLVVMPAYQAIEVALHDGRFDLEASSGQLFVSVGTGQLSTGVFESRLPGSEVPIYFIAESNLFDRPQLYGYGDDPYRFAFFCKAALELTLALKWQPDVIHAHDWHAAPAVTWLATTGQGLTGFQGTGSVFTIHNLAHQGRSPWEILEYLGVSSHSLVEEAYGEVNFMARGIYHATMINTVSPTYAREIMSSAGGAGLDGLLRHRAYDVHGILNGLDYDLWSPESDGRLAARFDADTLEKRQPNKSALQARANLPQRPEVPLVAMISRLDWQKGLDISGHVIHLLLNDLAGEAQFVVLGSGAPEYEAMLAQLANYHPSKMTAFLQFDSELAPLIYGGSDLFLMPSLFEPCGLGQMIAMRYGSVPVVRATGGLADTVQDGSNGFTFQDYNSGAFWQALERALHVFNVDKRKWMELQKKGMAANFSWQQSAKGYQQLYEWTIARMGAR